MRTDNIISFAGFRYLWIAFILVMVSLVLYLSHSSDQTPNGGTWQGYTLGVLATLLIVWLAVLGMRKRAYSSTMGTVLGWTSAHVYLGLTLIFIATLHTGFEFAWNIHFLAYLLMLVVILSGVVGLGLYQAFPRKAYINRNSMSFNQLYTQVSEQQAQILASVAACTPTEQRVVTSALERTQAYCLGLRMLSNRDSSKWECPTGDTFTLQPNPSQNPVREWLSAELTQAETEEHVARLHQLLEEFSRYSSLLKKMHTEYQLQSLFKLWLSIHIPCTLALLVALLVHILSTFMYW